MRQVKRIALLLALLLSLTLTAPVWADVIDEPPNAFFVTHEAACEYDRRWYCANSPRGYVNFREAPGGRVTEQAENGARVLSTVLYQDWVLVEYYGDVYWEGWAPRSELSVVYDDISFIEECGSQFVPCDRELVDALLSARESRYVVYWPYPNAERLATFSGRRMSPLRTWPTTSPPSTPTRRAMSGDRPACSTTGSASPPWTAGTDR